MSSFTLMPGFHQFLMDKPTWNLDNCLWEKSKRFWIWDKKEDQSETLHKHWAANTTRMSWERKKVRKKERIGVQLVPVRHGICCPMTQLLQKYCENCKEKKKNQFINNLYRSGVKVSQTTVQIRNIEVTPQAYSSSVNMRRTNWNLQRNTKTSLMRC